MKTRKILVLWSPLADYTVACFRQLAQQHDVELSLIYQPIEADAPYDQFDLSFCNEAVAYTKEQEIALARFCLDLTPDVILMASWNYGFYMMIAKKCRQKGTYVVSAFDGQWAGTWKQRLGIFVSDFFLRPSIDNFFVPGDRQANFARLLGYKNPFWGYCSANTKRFKEVPLKPGANKFIYVGRLAPEKGIRYLMSTYKKYRNSISNPWGLMICGTGALLHLCENQEGVEVYGFTQPAQLPHRLAEARCLVLPSLFEPWGLVVHEAALSGLAIISSYASGASTFYVRDGQNGYVINPDESALLRAMLLISSAEEEKLDRMSSISRELGTLWTTEKWADYVYQYICLHGSELPANRLKGPGSSSFINRN